MSEQNIYLSKKLSYLLRHHPESRGIKLDEYGWTDVEILCQRLLIDRCELEKIVEHEKSSLIGSHFRFNDDFTKVKANQGHSIEIRNVMGIINPPTKLFHGTKEYTTKAILEDGLKSMSRQHVHLSKDINTAIEVASRRKGKNVILEIQAKDMYDDDLEIYISDNGVYLIDYVPPKYIKIHTEE